MELEEAKELHRSLSRERRAADKEAKRWMTRRRGLDSMLQGLEMLHPELAPAEGEAPSRRVATALRPIDATRGRGIGISRRAVEAPALDLGVRAASEDTPRGKAAVIAVAQERPDKWFTPASMLRELVNRDWTPQGDDPETAVRVALRRGFEAGALERERRSRTFHYRSARPSRGDGS